MLVAPCWLSAQAVQECIENQLTNSYVKSVALSVLWTKATVNLTSNGFVVITPPINDLPYLAISMR